MEMAKHRSHLSVRTARWAGGLLLACCTAGCGSNSATPPPKTQQGPQTYLAPYVGGTTFQENTGTLAAVPLTVPQTYSFDDTANSFSQTTYQLLPPQQQGPQTITAGMISAGQRGLKSLTITADYVQGLSSFAPGNNGPITGSFAVELAGQGGGLVQLVGQPVAPLVAATQCPDLAKPQTYNFLTIPGPLSTQTAGQTPAYSWSPTTDTAYGSVDISSSGSTVTFNNIHQLTLPSVGGSGTPAQPATTPATGTCASSFFGNTITVAYPLVITKPGNGQAAAAQATIGIGPSGLLVESNGITNGTPTTPGTTPQPFYNNLLGAGTGAVGLPKPASALDTSALVGAQYLGFIYSAGVYTNGSTPAVWTSHLASFGFSNVPSNCGSVAAPTSTLIYGGDFPKDPSTSPDGFGNCDFAVDLGTQDSTTNGLYPSAQVWVGAGYGNATTARESFPAVAIAGQLNGKNAIFVLGVDSTQPWAIYLLQSN